MEFLIIGAGIGLVFGAAITRLFFPKKYYETKEIYDEGLVNNFNSLKTDYEVLKKELEMNIARKNEMLDFKNDMLREVKSTVKETTQEGQAPYIKKLITDSENVKSQLVDLENKKKDLERDKQLAERKNDEALLKGKYSINVRGVNSEDVMQQVILNSGFIEGKNVWFRKKQAGINGIPDATLTYPKGRKVICDSKAPLDKFDEIIEAGQIGDRDKITKLNAEFGKNVIKHVDDLSSKNYQKAVNSMDFVIMFLPSENHVRIARDCVQLHQKNLDDYAFEKNILVVGPSSFYPYVSKINELWKHHENIATQDNTLKVIKFAFKAIRILSELVDKTRKKIDEAARAAEDLDKSYNSTFTRAAEKVKDAGFSDDEIDKITNKNAEIIDLNDKKK
jgi:DNA recombination protein RmuC